METEARIDYFRSEIEGKISTLRNELVVQLAAANETIRQLSEKVDRLVRDVKNVELSVR